MGSVSLYGNEQTHAYQDALKEVLYRRIGRNEMSTIRVCRELVTAQKDYRLILADAAHWK